MKNFLTPLVTAVVLPSLSWAGAGPGPWANATYYPGNLDGKYQAAVSGENTSGVLGFAIRDGSLPFLEIERQSTGDAAVTDAVVVNQELEIDRTVNYYAIFVNGRTYTGTTAGAINYETDRVNGTLIGTAPGTLSTTNTQVTSQLLTNVTTTNEAITINDNGVITTTNTAVSSTNVVTDFITNSLVTTIPIATGVDGAFQANIRGKGGVFTFKGPGYLTVPGPVIDSQQVNETKSFNVDGIRVSFSSQASFQSVSTGSTPTGAP